LVGATGNFHINQSSSCQLPSAWTDDGNVEGDFEEPASYGSSRWG
jgi:hypothetical protein